MGVNIILNGYLYHFEDDTVLDRLLDQTADGVDETLLENGVLYDEEG